MLKSSLLSQYKSKETLTYFILWTLTVFYSIYRFSSVTHKYFKYYKDEYDDFTPGLTLFSTKRDKADLEWEAIMCLVGEYFPVLLIYLCVAQSIAYFQSVKILKMWHILFTIVYILIKWNSIFLVLLLGQPILFRTMKKLYLNKFSIWLSSSISLFFLNYLKSLINNLDISKALKLKDYEIYILVCSLFLMNLKCTSFSLDDIEKTNSLDFFSYCLYPPTVFSGPFILYKDFEYSKVVLTITKCKAFIKNVAKLLFWFIFVYISLHFVYLNAAVYQPQLVQNLDSWSLYGFGYTMGQFFHLKYVIQYGLGTSIASFQNINVPSLPRCIGRIHLYSDMWKYFDPGLYNFLIRHIYLPMLAVTENKPVRSFLCFVFVYIWHGLEPHILIWALLNYVGIILENIIWPKEGKSKTRNLQSWKRRKNCFVASFLLAMSAVSNFYFFAGMDVGHVFFRRIFTDFWGNVLLIGALYCCCQVSTELRTLAASKM